MIAMMRGTIIEISLNRAIIDVGGIGYEVIVAPSSVSSLTSGSEITLYTSAVIREDSWTLYGFSEKNAKELFVELQSVSGVGPKVAYSLISAISPSELMNAIATGENSRLEKVPGVGKKMASRIILELKDRYQSSSRKTSEPWRAQVVEALVSLGFQRKDGEAAIDRAQRDSKESFASLDLSEILRRCLSQSKAK